MSLTILSALNPGAPVEIDIHARIGLLTDASAGSALDPAILAAVDYPCFASLPRQEQTSPPEGFTTALISFAGERLLAGTPELLRYRLRLGGQLWLPVHCPGIPDADLIALEPRSVSLAAGESLAQDIRLSAPPTAPAAARPWLSAHAQDPNTGFWAELALILARAATEPQSAAAALGSLLKRPGRHNPLLMALAWRNLALLMARLKAIPVALELLAEAARQFPSCPEFPWLTALLHFRSGQLAASIRPLELAASLPSGDWPGSGGENSWRPRWLMGQIQEQLGNQEAAVEHYHAGLLYQPAFRPSVEALLRMRFGDDRVIPLLPSLRRLLVREPEYLPAVQDFLVANRARNAAAELTNLFPQASRPASQQPGPLQSAPVVVFQGPLLVHSSLAGTNRHIAHHLLRAGDLQTILRLRGYSSLSTDSLPEGTLLRQAIDAPAQPPRLTIRHFWPFDFSRPESGRLALITPWEYGAIPRLWVDLIRRHVDEQWVPSEFVRQSFLRAGIEPDRVHVIPNGIDPDVFRPEGESWRPPHCRGFVFLFVGGAILRKGVDILVSAFDRAFSADDDVTLLIKDLGSGSFYRTISLLPRIQEHIRARRGPDIQILTETLDVSRLAALYRGCDAFVLPYRGEGFGMPIAEAMACGKPVITTGLGPAPEFCPPDCGYHLQARLAPAMEPHLLENEFAGELTWFEPDVEHLAATLRHVALHPLEARQRGHQGAQWIHARYPWPIVLDRMLDRVRLLVQDAR